MTRLLPVDAPRPEAGLSCADWGMPWARPAARVLVPFLAGLAALGAMAAGREL